MHKRGCEMTPICPVPKQICTTETNSHAPIDFTIFLYVIYFHSNNTYYKSFFLIASTKPLSSHVFNFWEFYSLERSHVHNLGFTSNPTTSLTSENSSSNASSSSRRRFFSIEVGLLHYNLNFGSCIFYKRIIKVLDISQDLEDCLWTALYNFNNFFQP